MRVLAAVCALCAGSPAAAQQYPSKPVRIIVPFGAGGGTQRFADPSRGFLVLPNGTSAPAGLGAWQQGGPPVPPGSLVIVPNDPSPFESWGFLRDLTQVAGQLAISAAALAGRLRPRSASLRSRTASM